MDVQFFLLSLLLLPNCICSIEQFGELSWGVRIRETYQMHSEMSLIDCASLCLNNTGCCSINYSQMLHLCELNYQTKEHGTMYNEEETETFLQSNIETWKEGQRITCRSDRCGSNKQCTNEHRCVISDCGKLPVGPEHSYVVEHGHHVVGNGIVFACKDGYKLFTGKVASYEKYVVVKCSSDGIWDMKDFSCQGGDDFKPTDCTDVRRFISTESGVYLIKPQGSDTTFKVFCEMEKDGTAWVVFQRRRDGTVKFDREWAQYKTGFGSWGTEYWLGNDKLHLLSTQTESKLRIDLEDFDNNTAYALYGTFAIGPESGGYLLIATDFSGTAGWFEEALQSKAEKCQDIFTTHKGSYTLNDEGESDVVSDGSVPVYLNVYDMFPEINRFTYPCGIGVFHAGVEVYGREYSFHGVDGPGTGIYEVVPKKAGYSMKFRESILIGRTSVTAENVEGIINNMKKNYNYLGKEYHLLRNNCCSFSKELTKKLCQRKIPKWVNRLARITRRIRLAELVFKEEVFMA